MRTKRAKSWRVFLLAVCFVGPLMAWLGFGERGLVNLYRKEMERQAYVEKIRRLAEENQKMLEEIHRMRTDLSYVEAVARKELNLVKPNELIYRFTSEKSRHDAEESKEPNLTAQKDRYTKPETEVRHSEKNK